MVKNAYSFVDKKNTRKIPLSDLYRLYRADVIIKSNYNIQKEHPRVRIK